MRRLKYARWRRRKRLNPWPFLARCSRKRAASRAHGRGRGSHGRWLLGALAAGAAQAPSGSMSPRRQFPGSPPAARPVSNVRSKMG
jgi:hypothetical protein